MIELIIKIHLDGHLDVPSFFERQDNMPESFVIIEKTSGSSTNKLLSSTFAFQSYAPSLYEAALLNEKVIQIVDNLVEVDEVYGVHLNSNYNFTDPTTKEYRYQAVFDINHY